MSQENVNLVRRALEEVFNNGNLSAVDQLFVKRVGEQVKKGVEERRSSFPDLKYKIEQIVDEGDKVAFRYTVSATHRGAFKGIAATNKKVSWEGSAVVALKDNKVTDIDVVEDRVSKFIQLGKLPQLKRRLPITGSLTGVWTASQHGFIVTLDLKQTAAKVTGTAAVSGVAGTFPVKGTVNGGAVALEGSVATAAFKFAGRFVSPNQVDGQLSGAIAGPATLRKV